MTSPSEAPIRVVLADDTATMRLLLRRTLESSRAFEVVGEASDGGQAVALAAALQPDMVVLDMAMPVMGGLEAIPQIKRCAPGARVVVLSGFTPDRMGEQALDVGATAYLEKQLRPDELVAGLLQAWRSAQPAPDGEAAPPPLATDWLAEGFERAPAGMAVVDADDRFVHVNPALLRLTGYNAEELRRLKVADLAFAEDPEASAGSRRAVLAGEQPVSSTEARVVRPDGRTVWVLLGCAALPPTTADGTAHLVVQFTDISEQKRALRELIRSNADLSSFAFLAAHELKSPLQAMSGFAALLSQVYGPGLEPQAQEFVGWIIDGAARMDALVEDLLAYCSVDAAAPVQVEVALDDVVTGALAELDRVVTSRAAVVHADALPVVVGDPVELGQLLQNLLANALKFVPDGQAPNVEVSAQRVADTWLVTVADNGIGIEDASSDRIFAMFERLHPRERYKGTGIGLSICKRIVERRGGTIWVEHNPGGGSRFRFSIPDVGPAPVGTEARQQADLHT